MMRLYRKPLTAFPLLLLACGPSNDPADGTPTGNSAMEGPHALAGIWNDTGRAHTTWEHWKRQDDSTLVGIGCALNGTDTVSIEELRLEKRQGSWTYRVRVDRQAGAGWVPFAADLISRDSLVFENADHDFPQCITYVRGASGGWDVSVSGTDHGEERVDRYRFAPVAK